MIKRETTSRVQNIVALREEDAETLFDIIRDFPGSTRDELCILFCDINGRTEQEFNRALAWLESMEDVICKEGNFRYVDDEN